MGRGCLAGPFVVAAVILNPKHFLSEPTNTALYEQIKDSKKLTPKKRKELSDFIKYVALSYSIQTIDNRHLDQWGISKCTQIGFFNAVKGLKIQAQHTFTDSFRINMLSDSLQTNIVGGDGKSITIAAASIIAKVYRDELMVEMHCRDKYKAYCFDQHKGYGTKLHMEMIQKYGICDLHRKSFKPITDMIST